MQLEIRPFEENDIEALLPLWNENSMVPTTLELARKQEELMKQSSRYRLRLVGQAGDKLVAHAGLFEPDSNKPGWLTASIKVDVAERGKGYGRAIAEHISHVVAERRPAGLEAYVRDNRPESWAWAEARGFRLYAHRFDSQLDLEKFDLSGLDARLAAVEERGIRLLTMADLPPGEESQRRVYEAFARDIPLSPDGADRDVPLFHEFQLWIKHPNFRPEGVFLAVKGDQIVGMTIAMDTPMDALHTAWTGVDREHQGIGIAPTLKLLSFAYARGRGKRYMMTNNLSINERMLGINRRMGYEPLPGTWWLRKELTWD